MSTSDVTKKFLDDLLAQVLARLDHLGAKVDALDDRVSALDAKVDALDNRVSALDAKVDTRLKETRPIWDSVLARLDELRCNVDVLRSDMNAGFRDLGRKMDVLGRDVLQVHADQRDLEDRLGRPE